MVFVIIVGRMLAFVCVSELCSG